MLTHNPETLSSAELEQHDPDAVAPDKVHSFLNGITTQTPWWFVSTLFHILLLALVGLTTLTVAFPENEELMLVTVVNHPTPPPTEKITPKEGTAAILASTDPNQPINNVYTMKEFGEISNEWRTNDPNLNFADGAHGIPESQIMYEVKNPSERPGSKGESVTPGVIEDVIGFAGGAPKFEGKGNGFGLTPGDGNARHGFRDRSGHRNTYIKYNPGNPGGFKEWDDAVKRALVWLAYHQETDGHWDTKKYGASNRNDTAITGFALLAFLGYGHSEKVGEHKTTVQTAVKWLIEHQGPDGLIRSTEDDSATHRSGGYPMAIATLALCEAAAMANKPETRAAAQKAIDYCANIHQAGEGSEKRGWRYASKSEGDTSVTGWFIMALKTARVAGLKVPAESFDGAIHFIDSVEVKEKDAANGYAPASHYKYMPNADHPATAHRLTAIAVLARQFLGWQKEDLQASVEWFINKGGMPAFGGNGEKVDLYYWYYGSMAAFQQDTEIFKKWGHALLEALLPNQRKDGDEAGSWEPNGDYAGEWGRVGQTALSALCLEVWYRNPRVFEKK